MRRVACAITITGLMFGIVVRASGIDPNHKHAWCENVGWTDWHDANGGADGVIVESTFMGGYIWAENVGWICVGSGSPANGVFYENVDGPDFGVNIDENHDLFGLAWGENIGWVNFDTRDKGDERARIVCDESRLRGYVWSENVGWINLDDDARFIGGVSCDDPYVRPSESTSDQTEETQEDGSHGTGQG